MKLDLAFSSLVLCTFLSCNTKQNDNSKSANTHSKPSNITYLTASDTTGKIMVEDDFWTIIDESIASNGHDYQLQVAALEKILEKLPPTQIESFCNTFASLQAGSYTSNLWGAAYVINGGCSDDCFYYFREYLIANGKTKFYDALRDPETCAAWMKPEWEVNWQGSSAAAYDAYKKVTGKEMSTDFEIEEKLKGNPFNEDSVIKQYPKLFERFWSKGITK